MGTVLFNLGYRLELIGIMVLWWGLLLLVIYPLSNSLVGCWWVISGQDWMKFGVPLIHLGIAFSGLAVNYLGRRLKVRHSGNVLLDILRETK